MASDGSGVGERNDAGLCELTSEGRKDANARERGWVVRWYEND